MTNKSDRLEDWTVPELEALRNRLRGCLERLESGPRLYEWGSEKRERDQRIFDLYCKLIKLHWIIGDRKFQIFRIKIEEEDQQDRSTIAVVN